MKRNLIFYSCLILASTINAQGNDYMHLWSRLSVSLPMKEKWRLEVEQQHRRQNERGHEMSLTWNQQLMNSTRIWFHYRNHENTRWSISPFACYRHYSVNSITDQIKPMILEFRMSGAWEYQKVVRSWLDLVNRTALEWRCYENNSSRVVRMRHKLGLQWKLFSHLQISTYYEILVNLTGTDSNHTFDHDRIGCLIQYRPTSWLRLEAGYVHSNKLPKAADDIINEHNYLLHANIELPINKKL